MKVLIDGTFDRGGGGHTYLRNLLRFEPPTDMDVSVVVSESLPLPDRSPRIRRIDAPSAISRPLLRFAWMGTELPSLLRRERADVFFAAGGIILAHPGPQYSVATVFHNALPFDPIARTYDVGYQYVRLALLRRLLSRSLRIADVVIFVSEYGRTLVHERVGVTVRRSVVIRHGVDEEFFADNLARPSWVPKGRYILYVSPLEPYKAQLEVLRAFAMYMDSHGRGDEQLVFVGAEGSHYARTVRATASGSNVSNRVHFMGNRPHEELPAAYRNSSAIVFASRCENGPISLLEAVASGRPVLSSNGAAMREYGGEAVAYFNPDDPRDLAAKIASSFHGDDVAAPRHEWRAESGWARMADQTFAALRATRS